MPIIKSLTDSARNQIWLGVTFSLNATRESPKIPTSKLLPSHLYEQVLILHSAYGPLFRCTISL